MEHGFFHPSIGYWQTNSDVSEEVWQTYPSGTIEVPLKPGFGYVWINNTWVYDPPPPPVPTAEQNKAKAIYELQQTDWTVQPDVIAPDANPKLLNAQDFLDYRAALRTIAINPQAGNLTWPVKPSAQWS